MSSSLGSSFQTISGRYPIGAYKPLYNCFFNILVGVVVVVVDGGGNGGVYSRDAKKRLCSTTIAHTSHNTNYVANAVNCVGHGSSNMYESVKVQNTCRSPYQVWSAVTVPQQNKTKHPTGLHCTVRAGWLSRECSEAARETGFLILTQTQANSSVQNWWSPSWRWYHLLVGKPGDQTEGFDISVKGELACREMYMCISASWDQKRSLYINWIWSLKQTR